MDGSRLDDHGGRTPWCAGHRKSTASQQRGDIVAASDVTELTALPGLEVLDLPHTSTERGPWLERTPSPRLMLFAGRSHPELAHRIADELGIELGKVELKTFANGETYCRYLESIRGADVFIVQSPATEAERSALGAAHHDRRREARLGAPDHGRAPVVSVLAAGQEVGAPRADHREARGRDRSRWRASIASSRWTCTPGRSRGSSSSPSTT